MPNSKLPSKIFPFIWHFLVKFKPAVSTFIFFSIIAGLWGPLNKILIKNIIDLLPKVEATGSSAQLNLLISLIILNFLVFDNVTWRALTYIRAKFVPVIINDIIKALMNATLAQSQQFFQDSLSGKTAKQITNLADATERLITNIAANFFRGVTLLITAFAAAYFVHPVFSYILIIWFALFASVSWFMSKKLVSLSDTQAEAESFVVGELVDTISNHSNVRMFSNRSFESNRMDPFFKHQQKTYSNTYFYLLALNSIQGGLIALMIAFSAYFLVLLYAKNLVTIGDFALILGLSMETGHMMWYTMSQLDDFNKDIGKCNQSMLSLMQPVQVADKLDAAKLQCHRGKIEFINVQFQFDNRALLFKGKSLTIPGGQKVGLVGYSGGGKSTFVNLIMRLYDVSGGQILIDGQNIKEVTQKSLQESIGIIPQDPVLFQRSLMENIRYGRLEASDSEVIEAAKKAHAHEFIINLENKYDTLVGERGVKLSGGQRQRVAIARAILKNAPLLILDEATSQLDSVTEALIQLSLCELMQNKTTIVIAHRLSTLLNMDRILVFDKGKVVEDGTHRELVQQNQLYKALWDAQVGGFIGDGSSHKKN